jgi:hypothetical protein
MKTTVGLVTGIALTAAVIGFAGNTLRAGQSKNPDRHRGGQAVTQAGGKGNKAIWSADPERGWVRADERRQAQEQTRRSNGGKANIKKSK